MLDGLLRMNDFDSKSCNNGCYKQKVWNEKKFNLVIAWNW